MPSGTGVDGGLTARKWMVESDFGIALMPESAVTEEVRIGSLQILALPDVNISCPVFQLARRGGYVGPAKRALIDQFTSQ